MNGWEYITRVFDFRSDGLLGKVGDGSFDEAAFVQEANRLGWVGWELVNVMDTNYFDGDTKFVVATFKRPLTPQRRAELSAGTSPPAN